MATLRLRIAKLEAWAKPKLPILAEVWRCDVRQGCETEDKAMAIAASSMSSVPSGPRIVVSCAVPLSEWPFDRRPVAVRESR